LIARLDERVETLRQRLERAEHPVAQPLPAIPPPLPSIIRRNRPRCLSRRS
jgi:hypothetical protein